MRRGYERARSWLLLLALIIGISACLGPAPSGPSQSDLASEPETHLQMPGSIELGQGGHEARATPEGPIPSVSWRQYGTSTSWVDLVSYFDAELRTRGWSPGGGSSGVAYLFGEEFGVTAWSKGDRILRLGHRRFVPNDNRAFPTFYEVALIGEGVRCCASATP
jgi:hypothetical protein